MKSFGPRGVEAVELSGPRGVEAVELSGPRGVEAVELSEASASCEPANGPLGFGVW